MHTPSVTRRCVRAQVLRYPSVGHVLVSTSLAHECSTQNLPLDSHVDPQHRSSDAAFDLTMSIAWPGPTDYTRLPDMLSPSVNERPYMFHGATALYIYSREDSSLAKRQRTAK